MDYEILHEDFSDIVVSYIGNDWKPENKDLLEDIRNEEERLQERGWYNGELFRLDSHGLSGDRLELNLENTDYASYRATRDIGLEKDNRADPLSVSGLVVSGNQILVGRRTDSNDAASGEYGLPAGFLERSEDQLFLWLGAQNPVYREVEEETGLGPEHFESMSYHSLVRSDRHNPSLIYRLDVGSVEQTEGQMVETDELEDLGFVGEKKFQNLEATPNCQAAAEMFFR